MRTLSNRTRLSATASNPDMKKYPTAMSARAELSSISRSRGQQVRVGGGMEDVGVGHEGYSSSSTMTTGPFGRQLTVSLLSSRRPMPSRGSPFHVKNNH